MTTTCDFLVIGAGIIGLSIARELRRRHQARVMVIDKEPLPGMHASGRNSGVLHAGVYYKAGTLKAQLCVDGNRRMRGYCASKRIPLNESGKVIVARSEKELPALKELYARSEANGVRSELVDTHALREIEPCAKTIDQALYVKDTAVVNPQRVMEAVVEDARREGVTMQMGSAWRGREGKDLAQTSGGRIAYGHLVNCAGLFADRIAWAYEAGLEYRILPFRGQFYRLRSESKVKVRGNIYPVPDLRNPFLGVHFTRRPDGEVTIGPSALPLLGREQYRGLNGITMQDAMAMATYLFRLFSRNHDHFRSIAWHELLKISKSGFFQEARGLANGFEVTDLQPGKEPGIRAQLVQTRTAQLMNDFVVESGVKSTHVLNAVSPAFTSSLPFAEHVVGLMKCD
jgi:L-2-hydroxyglutarate oxidase LhgO